VAGKLMWRPSDPAGAWRGIALDIELPGALACATQRAYPTHFINSFSSIMHRPLFKDRWLVRFDSIDTQRTGITPDA